MKRRLLFIFLSVAAIGLLIWLILPTAEPPEPSYQGKPLHEWLALYTQSNGTLKGYDPAVDEAIRHIGTNAIPTLLKMLHEHDSRLKTIWIALMKKQHIFKPPQEDYFWNFEAISGFRALGQTAVPALVQDYRAKISDPSRWDILGALSMMGPAALPAATPVLLDGLTNSASRLSMGTRAHAASAIGQIHGQPEVFVPSLINALKDSSYGVRMSTIRALGEYGPAAKSAVPALVRLLNDPDSDIRDAVKEALKAIDPVAASAAGVK